MSSTSYLTNMLAGTKSIDEELLLYEVYTLIKEVCAELVPQIVREELLKIRQDLIVNVIAEINGRQANLPEMENYIRQLIDEVIKRLN